MPEPERPDAPETNPALSAPGAEPDTFAAEGEATATPLQKWLVGIGIVVILALVFYGLNVGSPEIAEMRPRPPAASPPTPGQGPSSPATTGSAPAQESR